MKDKQIRVVVKPVDGDWEIRTIPNTLKALQSIVGGYIECAQMTTDYTLVCNEEGRINGMKFNQRIFNYQMFGDFLIARTKGEDFVSMDQDEAEDVIRIFRVKKG